MNLYVGNLPFKITESELEEIFAQFGTVTSVKIIMDRQSEKSKGFGFVEMAEQEEGKKAIEKLHGSTLQNRQIIVDEARPQQKKSSGGSFSRRR